MIKIIYFIGVIVGIFGFFYAIYKSIQLVFAINFVMIDQTSIKEGLQKSTMITAGRWWGIFGRFFVSGLVIWLGLVVISFVLSIISRMIPAFEIITSLIDAALQFLVSPLILSITIILFNEAKKTPVSAGPVAPPTPMSPPTPSMK